MRKTEKNVKKGANNGFYKTIVFFAVVLIVIISAIGFIVNCLYGVYKDSYYPSNVLDGSSISAFSKIMDSGEYKELKEIAEEMADGGNGYLIYPTGRNVSFDYQGDILSRLTASTGTGYIVVAKGTGNIQEDILAHVNSYYTFVGKVDPVYSEKVSESGSAGNYYADYSAGYLDCGNFFKREGLYLIALEYRATATESLFVTYVTGNYKELSENFKVIKQFAELALEGKAVPEEEQSTEQEVEDISSDDIDEISEYISEKYGVSNEPVGTVSGNSMDESQEEIDFTIGD